LDDEQTIHSLHNAFILNNFHITLGKPKLIFPYDKKPLNTDVYGGNLY